MHRAIAELHRHAIRSLLWRSAIPAWGFHRSRRTRSLMRSLSPRLTARAWDCGLAAPLLNRTAAACGLPTTLRAAQLFNSPCPPRSRRTHNLPSCCHLLANLCSHMAIAHRQHALVRAARSRPCSSDERSSPAYCSHTLRRRGVTRPVRLVLRNIRTRRPIVEM